MTLLSPIPLPRKQLPKPWDRGNLSSPFETSPPDCVGEIWFDGADLDLQLLVKYIFTSQKLSIQVHPFDGLARQSGLPSGKEECWIVIDAVADATLGIGTKEPLSSKELRSASLDGSIKHLIEWKPTSRGDVFYIPAGTVHAIGAGVAIIELQQKADVTYRIYDYGHPRQLHLDEATAAASAEPYDNRFHSRVDFTREGRIWSSPKFDLWLSSTWPEKRLSDELVQIIPVSGVACIDGVSATYGECLVSDPRAKLGSSSDFMPVMAQAKSCK